MADPFPFEVPEISGPIASHITKLERAYVVPPPKGGPNQSVQRSGVLTAEGAPVENAVTWRGTTPVTVPPAMPEGEVDQLEGRWLFLGPLFGHFGHFLVESICRIWAVDQLRGQLDGVLYVPKFQNRPEHVANVYRPFLEALGVDLPMRNIEDPAQVEQLFVPRQGFGMFQMIEGAPEFRAFIRAHAGKTVAPEGSAKIYISRSELPGARGSVLFERRLEGWLEAEGYVPYHPQKHSHLEQIAAYRAARHIIAVDCSPLHLLGMVGDEGQKVGVIARRDGDLDEIFARQIRAFQGAEARAFNHLRRNWIEAHGNRPSRTSWGELDYPALRESLMAAGLIKGVEAWEEPTEADYEAELDRIAAAAGHRFKPWDGPKGKAPGDGD
ncbi:glycosyltransferase family 61 protein [Pseudoroseicyclus tamaricis]|uniref:Glycosyltransferase family 61 protein n=1 Tax=Pseudoroseicyclus tamaricis TaxID=2705421 RepID=A0A6B2JUA8_9RHOB|nr:glycosyltransferase 61 family protein [Pseudoroseicyclus tamaricis]NDV01515.1 glycosyltransferase family 61 protein [Pseudoroseicyclus tamaricis]